MKAEEQAKGPLILGATGQVGQALARVWPQQSGSGIWQHRPGADPALLSLCPGPTLEWDLLSGSAPSLPQGISGMVVLAGVMGGDETALARNREIALAAVAAARAADIPRILVASSQAVYGTEKTRVSEADSCHPIAPYGRAKWQMERALAGQPGVTCLRLGNVVGADNLFRTAGQRAITLDKFPDGQNPRRSYIGPVSLAQVLVGLLDPALDLPAVLNVASPGLVSMGALMQAAGVPFEQQLAPLTALPELELDVSQLLGLVPLAPATPEALIAEARQGGWRASM